jgi:hypothetical protein
LQCFDQALCFLRRPDYPTNSQDHVHYLRHAALIKREHRHTTSDQLGGDVSLQI